MNRFMKSQVDNVLLSMKVLDQSIEMAAIKDDGQVSKAEEREIKEIHKAIHDFQRKMEKLMR